MREKEMADVAAWILRSLESPDNAQVQAEIRGQVRELCADFPVPAAQLEIGDASPHGAIS